MLDTQLALIILVSLSLSWFAVLGSETSNPGQEVTRYFRLDEESDSWVPVELPYDLVTCVNDNCTVVGSISEVVEKREDRTVDSRDGSQLNDGKKAQETYKRLLPVRKRVSLTKMSETSIWITGESGSIYERFWNGVQWVIAPHELPSYAGPAVSVFIVNQTILALSEEGCLYQMQLTENTQLVWREFAPAVDHNANREQEKTRVKSGIVSDDGERIYLCSKNGSLLELVEVEPPRWLNHGQPPGADVAAIADAGTIRQNVVFTISSSGDLYEYDRSTRPSWKKHVKKGGSVEEASLIPSRGYSAQGLAGVSSMSLFLVTKAGELIERRLNQRKWKWIAHGTSEDLLLTAITPVPQDESSEKLSVFLTTATGSILEYQLAKQAVKSQENQIEKQWVNHLHPPHAKVARGVAGMPYQFGRILFPLDDGRLGELHLSGIGGENSGPLNQVNFRKRGLYKYAWSILDAPETEGWNAEYCVDERGPSNCMMGVKDEANDFRSTRTLTRRRKGVQQNYLIPDSLGSNLEHKISDSCLNNNFRLRVMQGGRSFFLVTGNGLTLEYLYNDDVGLWLRHENPTSMNGAVGSYNGSLFLVDIHGSLLIRERSNNQLQWINCTALKKGKQIIGGPPWDLHGTTHKSKSDDALYFISKKGRLLQFTVANRIFRWKDCKNPGNTKIAAIVDQEMFRNRVVFVIGTNGRLYQFNTLSGNWHEHQQSPHLILSKVPGTAMRQSARSLRGSLFMISEDGGLVEYHWNAVDGWMWVEHGTPNEAVSFKGAPGPVYGGNQLLLVGSDGNVYLRYLERGEWKWRDCSFPDSEYASAERERQKGSEHRNKGTCADTGSFDNTHDLNRNCDSRVASTRPILSEEDKLIFELRDGRLAEMQRVKDTDWVWSKILATPTSLCVANLWASAAS